MNKTETSEKAIKIIPPPSKSDTDTEIKQQNPKPPSPIKPLNLPKKPLTVQNPSLKPQSSTPKKKGG